MAALGKLRPLIAILAGLALTVSACGKEGGPTGGSASSPKASYPLTLTDDDGVSVTLDRAPMRIVTWGPSMTEILFAVGLGDRVVGVSGSFDNYPAAAKSITHVGGGASGTTLNVEKVVSLKADLVLNAFLGGKESMKGVRDAGIPAFSLYAASFADALHDIRTLGQLTGAAAGAGKVTAQMSAQARSVQQRASQEEPVPCFLDEGFYSSVVYTVGPGSIEFDLLKRSGCDPVTSELKSPYPQLSKEDVVRQNPAVYLVASPGTAREVKGRPGFGGIAAIREGRVHEVNSDLLLRPGPRVVMGLTELAKALHPSAFS